jgi:hypothetical protein
VPDSVTDPTLFPMTFCRAVASLMLPILLLA